jgi:hypothetical protein
MNRFFRAMAQNYRVEAELPAALENPLAGTEVRWKNSRLNYPSQLAPCKR